MNESNSSKLIVPGVAGMYETLSNFAMPLMRVVLGLALVPHGAQKLFGWFGGGGIEGTAKFFASVNLEPAMPMVIGAGFVEFFCGIALAIGFLTRIAGAGITILAIVALVTYNIPRGFWVSHGGAEHMILVLVIGFVFFVHGGGKLSVDRMIGREF